MPAPLTLAASIAAAPLLSLGEELERLREAGVDAIHIDVEDGVFVPAMNLGLRVLEETARWGRLPVDVHLMVVDPERVLDLIQDVPLRSIAIHAESTQYPRRVLQRIVGEGRAAGLALNPATPMPRIAHLAPYLDHVLVLSSEPELTGSPYLPGVLDASLVKQVHRMGARVVVDGGVNEENAHSIAGTGADGVVVGRALFAADDPAALVRNISRGEQRA